MVTITIPSKGRKDRLADCLLSIDYPDRNISIGAGSFDDLPMEIIIRMPGVSCRFLDAGPVLFRTPFLWPSGASCQCQMTLF